MCKNCGTILNSFVGLSLLKKTCLDSKHIINLTCFVPYVKVEVDTIINLTCFVLYVNIDVGTILAYHIA